MVKVGHQVRGLLLLTVLLIDLQSFGIHSLCSLAAPVRFGLVNFIYTEGFQQVRPLRNLRAQENRA